MRCAGLLGSTHYFRIRSAQEDSFVLLPGAWSAVVVTHRDRKGTVVPVQTCVPLAPSATDPSVGRFHSSE